MFQNNWKHYYKTPIRQRRLLTGKVCDLIDTCLSDNARKRQSGVRQLCMKASDIHAAQDNAGQLVSYPSVCKYIRMNFGHAGELSDCYILLDFNVQESFRKRYFLFGNSQRELSTYQIWRVIFI